MVAENLISQCEDCNYRVLFDEIIDHKHGETGIPIGQDNYFEKRYGKTLPIQSLQGWLLCVRWKDDSLSWVPLKYMYESEILKTAEYAVMNKLTEWPTFKWWIDDGLKTRGVTGHRFKKGELQLKTFYVSGNEDFVAFDLLKHDEPSVDIDQSIQGRYTRWERSIKRAAKLAARRVRRLQHLTSYSKMVMTDHTG